MAARNGRMLSSEVEDIVRKNNERLYQKKVQRLRREEKLQKEIAKTEAQLEKLKASS